MEEKFTAYMLLFTFGILLIYTFIIPLFSSIDVPFLVERNFKYKYDDKLLRINKLDFNGVPAIFYQYYDNNTKVNSLFVNTINENILNSDEFDIYLFNDKDSRHFILTNFDEELVNIFDKLSNKQKISLWLYCILYTNGGIYININMKMTKPLLDILSLNKSNLIFTKQSNYISNKFICAKPGEQIFKDLIESYYTGSIKSLSSIVNKNYTDHIKFVVDKEYNIRNIETNEICFEAIKY
jgi:mannosyltransferase OCH1-like enzyme